MILVICDICAVCELSDGLRGLGDSEMCGVYFVQCDMWLVSYGNMTFWEDTDWPAVHVTDVILPGFVVRCECHLGGYIQVRESCRQSFKGYIDCSNVSLVMN